MPSTKAIRKRIHSVKNTQKITKAMKMVAAAKLRRAQNQILAFRPYAKGLDKTVFDLMSHIGKDSLSDAFEAETPRLESALLLRRLSWFFQPREERKIRLLLVTSDRGLCGGFNSSVFRRAEQFLIEKEHCHIEVDIVGKKGRDYVRRRMREIPVSLSVKNRWHSHEIHAEHLGVDSKNAFQYAKTIAQSMQEARDGGAVDAVYVIYNQFHSAAKQAVTVQKLLPFDGALDASPQGALDYLYEPFKEDVFEHLLPLYFEAEIYRILLDSIASQFGAQMSAMDNASRNAKEMISRLTLQMNRARQAAITKELMEIIGGAEALKG